MNPDQLTPQDLEAMRRVAEAATAGPWLWDRNQEGDYAVWTRQPHTGTLATVYPEDINGEYPVAANAAHIATFHPRAVIALLDRIAAKDAEVERLRDKVDALDFELTEAVKVAYSRGATTWTRMNYPKIYAALESST